MELQVFQLNDKYIVGYTIDSTPLKMFDTEQEAITYLESQ